MSSKPLTPNFRWKKSDSPDEDKTISDSAALNPILTDFFAAHPNIHPDTFLGDSAFDSAETYRLLRNDFGFQKMLIPYNPRNESTLKKVGFNEFGYPTCPNDPSLDMKYCGVTKEKGRSDRVKWCCPKIRMVKGEYVCDCKEPCSPAKKDAPPTPMITWIFACSPVFSATPMNGMISTRSEPS